MKHFIKAQAKLLVTVLTLVVVLGIGATVAYLHDTTGVVRNIFDPAQLDTKIEETLGTNGTKQVVIANTGKSDAYVRARVMVSGVKNGQLQIVDSLNEVAEDSSVVYLVMPNVGTGEKNGARRIPKSFTTITPFCMALIVCRETIRKTLLPGEPVSCCRL